MKTKDCNSIHSNELKLHQAQLLLLNAQSLQSDQINFAFCRQTPQELANHLLLELLCKAPAFPRGMWQHLVPLSYKPEALCHLRKGCFWHFGSLFVPVELWVFHSLVSRNYWPFSPCLLAFCSLVMCYFFTYICLYVTPYWWEGIGWNEGEGYSFQNAHLFKLSQTKTPCHRPYRWKEVTLTALPMCTSHSHSIIEGH